MDPCLAAAPTLLAAARVWGAGCHPHVPAFSFLLCHSLWGKLCPLSFDFRSRITCGVHHTLSPGLRTSQEGSQECGSGPTGCAGQAHLALLHEAWLPRWRRMMSGHRGQKAGRYQWGVAGRAPWDSMDKRAGRRPLHAAGSVARSPQGAWWSASHWLVLCCRSFLFPRKSEGTSPPSDPSPHSMSQVTSSPRAPGQPPPHLQAQLHFLPYTDGKAGMQEGVRIGPCASLSVHSFGPHA